MLTNSILLKDFGIKSSLFIIAIETEKGFVGGGWNFQPYYFIATSTNYLVCSLVLGPFLLFLHLMAIVPSP
jgi:hypothetical protein